jgi:predicted metallo-beta-lactamase superfamily hydrolase
MGVRSTSTLVETENHRIVIDPSAALAPRRFDLPPSEIEKNILKQFKSKINEAVKSSDIMVISHYHHDHFNPRANFYSDKNIFVKSWKSDINYSQRQRALKLKSKFKRLNVLKKVKFGDGTIHEFKDDLEISYSHAVPHGPIGTEIGYVIMTTIREPDFNFMYCSDVQGPVEPSTVDIIIDSEPDLIYLDGPPLNLLETQFSRADLEKAINNILDIINYTYGKVILDHHLLRDVRYRDLLKEVFKYKSRVRTAAEYIGKSNTLLEATRNELWETEG